MAILPAVLLLTMLQATPASDPQAVALTPKDHVASCGPTPSEDGDIVVCGRKDRDEQYRLRPLTHRYERVSSPGPGVGFKVGAGRGNLYSTSQISPDGKPDKRIMARVVLPF